ncbi:hypothetical protein EL22_28790 [Halostagnicola sp. A56]|nr:hypothetical protein EL22_28790 [Halostagnicola sp. A56]
MIEHPNPDGFLWIIVNFELLKGDLNTSDIMGLTQVETSEQAEFTRGMLITSPDEELILGDSDDMTIDGRTQAEAYYRVSDDASSGVWVIEFGELEGKLIVKRRIVCYSI